MRRPLVIATLLLAALGLAACGGGGSNGSSSSSASTTSSKPAADTPEATWAKEVRGVMSYFENHISAQQLPTIQDTYNQRLLEPLYRTYGHDLGTLANKLEATKAPAGCVAAKHRIADTAKQFALLNTELGERSQLNEKQYSLFLEKQGDKIHTAGVELTELTARPHC